MTATIIVTKALSHKLIDYVKKNGSINNRQCDELLGVGYDQAISIFNQMVKAGDLV